jgi:glucosyl-dolichyl phosphate glucuronosyltransferase
VRSRYGSIDVEEVALSHRPPKTSLITCAYNLDRWHDLVEAVASARGLKPPPDEIIIVIDHNPELKKRAEREFTNLRIVENQNPRGVSGARNAGIAAASGELIAFLDDDAVADSLWLAVLQAVCEQPGVLGVMGRIEPLWCGGVRPSWFPDEFLWVIGCTYRGLPTSLGGVRNLFGCMCFRREVFNSVGPFNTDVGRTNRNLPLGCEDTELCIRAQKIEAAIGFMFEPRALVWHKIPAKRLTFHYFWLRCYAEGLSKAQVLLLQRSTGVLSSERKYVLHVLTRGVARGLGDAIVRFDAGGLWRVFAITTGLLVAIAGFCVGKVKSQSAADDMPAPLPNSTP